MAVSPEVSAGQRRHKPDHWLLIDTLLLLLIGLVLIYSISPALADTTGTSADYFIIKQLVAIGLALVAFYITAKVPLSRWRSNYKLLLGIAALATLIAIALPVNPSYPAHRWVRFAGLSFESVEMLIFATLIWFAHFLAVRIGSGSIRSFIKTVRPILAALLIIGGVVAIIQSDLGSTGVIVAMMGVMVFVAGMPMKRIAMVAAIVAGLGLIAILAFPYRLSRLETFLHPSSNCQSSGYQACQALIAVGSGGISGLGLGSDVQAYGYLPEADNDSIFAIYAEKFGFIGSVILLAVFASLFWRMAKVAEGAPDDFSRLIVVGALTWISVETLINVGAMIGLLPLKGITLPFISYGGTSVVFFAAAIGLVYQVSRYTSHVSTRSIDRLSRRAGINDYSSHRRRIGGAYNPDFSGRG
ncbi:MAG: FtsW/RodA/SpoVE family cell cycle protein [Candidatus Saccharimonadales bacterium]